MTACAPATAPSPSPDPTPCDAPLELHVADGGAWVPADDLRLWALDAHLTTCERDACRERLMGEEVRRLAAEAALAEAEHDGWRWAAWTVGAAVLGVIVGGAVGWAIGSDVIVVGP